MVKTMVSGFDFPLNQSSDRAVWRFQTFFIFHFIYGIILPIDELHHIFQDGEIAPPTREFLSFLGIF